MASSKISGVKLSGIASAVPRVSRLVSADAALLGEAETERFSLSTGVRARRVAGAITAGDLCEAAAGRLLEELGWRPSEVDALIFVSQTPDYRLPATACVLHGRLGLNTGCAALDVNLGCSGYPYGLWLGAQMIQSGMGKVLVLAGDTITRTVSPEDRSVALLFGDAGSATALERAYEEEPIFFELGTDGQGARHLMVPAGGFRQPYGESCSQRIKREDGNVRADADLFMDGPEIFSFSLERVPPLMRAILGASGWTIDEIDKIVFHQANRFMLQHLAKKLKIPADKVVLALEEFGNTSCASIPLAMTARLAADLRTSRVRMIFAGFGVGFSWAAAAVKAGPMVMPELVEVSEPVRSVDASV